MLTKATRAERFYTEELHDSDPSKTRDQFQHELQPVQPKIIGLTIGRRQGFCCTVPSALANFFRNV